MLCTTRESSVLKLFRYPILKRSGGIEMTEEAEIALPGGNIGGAVRVGSTVRRPTGPWTPAVHGLLNHLAAAGLAGVPRVLGFDDRGREILDFLPGEAYGEQVPDEVLED